MKTGPKEMANSLASWIMAKTERRTLANLFDATTTFMSGYMTGHTKRASMSNASQKRATKNYRKRLQRRGMARFDVLGLDTDRGLIRSLAKRLTEDDPDAIRIRTEINRALSEGSQKKRGGLLSVLRLPSVEGLELEIERPFDPGRKIDL